MARPEHRSPDPTSGARRMAVIVTATVLGGMIAAVGVIGSQALEPRLTQSARTALIDAGFSSVQVRFDGREAFLSSATATAARLDAAKDVVEQVDGVRWATVVGADATPGATSTPTPTPSPTPTPTPDAETIGTLTSTEVLFEPDSTVLSAAALSQLSQVAGILTEFPELRLSVTGHVAIPTGTPADAIAFSELRAQAVIDELVRLGVAPSRLEVVGAGTDDAVGDNSTPEGAARNRRVTFELQEGS